MSDALAGDVSLNLRLVDSIDTAPDECPSNAYGPKSVPSQRVCVKACVGEKEDKVSSPMFLHAFLRLLSTCTIKNFTLTYDSAPWRETDRTSGLNVTYINIAV